MTNGHQWAQRLEKIRAMVEPILLVNAEIPDDFFPAKGSTKFKSATDWWMLIRPGKPDNSWMLNGEPCIGIRMMPDRAQAGFSNDGHFTFTEQLIEVGNWPGFRALRTLLLQVAGDVQLHNLTTTLMGKKISPMGDFLVRARADMSAHELLAMQTEVDRLVKQGH